MAFRVNRSFSIVPGVRFRVNKGSFGLTLGKGPLHYTVNSRGRRTSSVGLPGTGMYFQQSHGGSSRRRSTTRRAPTAVREPAPAVEPTFIQGRAIDAIAAAMQVHRPGLFAPRAQKALHRALAATDLDAVEAIGTAGGPCALAANTLLAISTTADGVAGLERSAAAIHRVLTAGGEPGTDRFLNTFTPGLRAFVPVTEQVSAELPMSATALALLYVEDLQALGRIDEAAEYVATLARDEVSALSLAELSVALERWDAVIDLTTGVANTDDYTALMLVYRGMAFREQGHFDAARAAFRDALRSKKRSPLVRHLALFARARCSVDQRRIAAARKDLETILNEDPDYEGLQAALDALGPARGAKAEAATDTGAADVDDTDDTEPEDTGDPEPDDGGPPTMLA